MNATTQKLTTGQAAIVQQKHTQRKVEILSPVEGSRTLFIVRDTDRGAGYNEHTGKYKGVFYPGGWMRGQNYDFGQEFTAHINQIQSA
jgi:hypothetical protein